MNPLRWRREHQIACVLLSGVGAMVGVFYAWLESPFHEIATHNVSGPWADVPSVFFKWLSYPHLYWPWPVFGAAGVGMTFYAVMLLKPFK